MEFAKAISFNPADLHQLVCFVVLTFALLSHAPQAQAQVMEKGLVSYWSFDKADVEGEIVKDGWGKNDGVFFGSPKQVAGKVGEDFQYCY